MLKRLLKYSIAAIGVIFLINVVYFTLAKKPNVAVIKINGIITPQKANQWIKEIKKASDDPHIKAILIKVNSGGGEAVSSQRLYYTIKRASHKKFTIALIESIGASGAYYASCGADKIVSYPASIVGSIGVIFETLNFSNLAKKIGVTLFVVKSGSLKDVGNPFRKPTTKDREMLKNVIESVYTQFLKAVSKSRNIPLNKLKPIANGSIFSGTQALKLKLVDSIGGINYVKKIIKKKTGVKQIVFKNLQPYQGIIEKITSEVSNYIDYITLLSQPSIKAITLK